MRFKAFWDFFETKKVDFFAWGAENLTFPGGYTKNDFSASKRILKCDFPYFFFYIYVYIILYMFINVFLLFLYFLYLLLGGMGEFPRHCDKFN